MTVKDRFLLSIFCLTIFFALIYNIRSILTPFVVSVILAYFLNPPVDYLHKKHNVCRSISTLLIITLFITFNILLFSYITPIIYTQFIDFINTIPSYIKVLYYDIYPEIIAKLERSGIDVDQKIHDLFSEGNAFSAFDISKNILNGAITSSFSLINMLSLIFISPILVFYFLKDWDVIVNNISDHLPKKSASTIKQVIFDIDRTLSKYIRGQANVCLLLGIFYAVALNYSGLNFGFLIGFLTGIFSFIPYFGVLIGIAIGLVVALFQWGLDLTNLSTIVIIFAVGQFIEGNFVAPKLIGDKIGIHPAWIIFGLFFFGVIFGFFGILIAVPLTAICSVLIKFFAAKYREKYTK